MCTAATYKSKDFYFGRTLDYEFSYGCLLYTSAKDENKGKIEIEYYNKEDLDRLIDMILKQNKRSERRKYDI